MQDVELKLYFAFVNRQINALFRLPSNLYAVKLYDISGDHILWNKLEFCKELPFYNSNSHLSVYVML